MTDAIGTQIEPVLDSVRLLSSGLSSVRHNRTFRRTEWLRRNRIHIWLCPSRRCETLYCAGVHWWVGRTETMANSSCREKLTAACNVPPCCRGRSVPEGLDLRLERNTIRHPGSKRASSNGFAVIFDSTVKGMRRGIRLLEQDRRMVKSRNRLVVTRDESKLRPGSLRAGKYLY